MSGVSPPASETVNQLWSRALLEEFVRAGVSHAVICPGSRSTPLALACAEQRSMRCWSVIDERSAGFVALGMAKHSGIPPLLVATSGTAGAHFYPAVIEASQNRIPLVILTADRPWELHGFGAPQTIPQGHLFGGFAQLFLDLGLPEASEQSVRHLRASVHRALYVARAAPGGVAHLNVPFRDPLTPSPAGPFAPALLELSQRGRADAPFTAQQTAVSTPRPEVVEALAARIAKADKGLILAGPRDAEDGLAVDLRKLAEATSYPLLAEAASQVRFGPGGERVISHYDALLRSESFAAAHRPDLILRFGGGVTAKGVQAFVDRSGAEVVVFSDRGMFHDPGHAASAMVHGDPTAWARTLAESIRRSATSFAEEFFAAELRVRKALATLDSTALTEPQVARAVVSALPPKASLFLASSMPIRDVDAFATASERPLRVFSNRGANGIDGTLSSAIGVSASSGRPVVALTGDLAFLHDLGALLTAQRMSASLCVVVVNNGGGGIFSFLPIAQRTEHFESLFATSHQVAFEGLGKPFGFRYAQPQGAGELAEEVRKSLEGGLHLLEVKVPSRSQNVQLHQELFDRLTTAVEGRG